MNKIVIILLCFIPYIFQAQEFSIDLVNEETLLTPGKVQSLVFKITNPYSNTVNFTPEITLPKGWTLAAIPYGLTLEAQESKIYIVSVDVPIYASEVEYNIGFILDDVMNDRVQVKRFALSVKKVQKIGLEVISKTKYVKAGDTIHSSFILKNEGNLEETVFISPSAGTFIKGDNPILLLPGKSITIEAFQITDSKQARPSQNLLKLTASLKTDSIQTVFASQQTDVIPMFQVNDDIWLRFPIKVSASYMGGQYYNDFKTGFQGEIYGKGSLNEENTKELEFRAIGPDRFNLTSFSQYEEYFVNYKSPNFFVHLGDKTFSSSTLTEFARYGRGVELRKKINKVELGGFYNKPRFYSDIKDEFNLYAKFDFNSKNNIRYGYLLKRMEDDVVDNHLHYIYGEGNLFNKIDLQGEYAISEHGNTQGQAWQLQGQAYFKNFNINASYIYASPAFSGYYTNTDFFTSNVNYRILPKWILTANYQKDARNFEKDTLYSAAPYRERLQLGVQYNYLKRGTISAFHGVQEYEDRMEQKQFFYKEVFNRLELLQDFSNFTLNFQAFFAETTNFLTNSMGKSSLYTANISYNYKESSFNLYGSYSKANRYEMMDDEQFLFGGSINTVLFKKLNARVFYQNTYYLEDYYTDRNLFELSLNYRLTPRQQIDLISRYTLPQRQIEKKDFSFSLRYTIDINAPIKKIKDYGTLRGNITNLHNVRLEGLKIYLGSHAALVDSKGDFVFKNVKPDTYFLEIDQETLGIKDIPDIAVPIKITILEGENYINFGLTKASNVIGTIVFEKPFVGENKQSVIVELSSDTEVIRKICDVTKPFDFTYLKPGDWKLKVYNNGLDAKYKIETNELNFSLNPDEEKVVSIKISEIKKDIKYLQQPIKVGFNKSKVKQ